MRFARTASATGTGKVPSEGARSRQDSHRFEAAAVRRLAGAGLRARGMRGQWPAPSAPAALQPARHCIRYQEKKEEWQKVCLLLY